ncbi:PAS domain-containing protein [Nonlabens ulvanivorans]|uniref:PAS domain-containing protein n=2 Tax=Nonlabens ulvanivorans TaxID=906888 RepID=UPI003267894F
MTLENSQYTVINSHINSLPMLSWELIKKLLWNLDKEMLEHMNHLAQEYNWHFNYFLDSYSHYKGYSIVITDHNFKIQCCSENIFKMTGYKSHELTGHSPKLLQGEKTDQNSKRLIKKATQDELPFNTRLVNYRKNGELYGCEIIAFPIFNGTSKVSHFIAFEKEYFV